MTTIPNPPMTCDLCDQHKADRSGAFRVLPPVFQSYGARQRFAGAVVTVKCFEDNTVVKAALESPGEGRVLVVDGGGSLRRALMGDNVATIAVKSGWEGVVVFGAIRDSAAIVKLDLGVKALGTMPRSPRKAGVGDVDVPVSFGGVEFFPGARLCSDEDGLVVLPA